ncbi:MAG: sulfatase family protein [Planctomycetota bacterium]|jgi:arylsulfatase A-like enzyme
MSTVTRSLRSFHFLILLLAGFALTLAAGAGAEESPNIILMMADDLGYGDTGFNGNTVIQTPHLDRMARDGAIMTNFHSGGPVCSPTRGTFVTGRHYFRYGIFSANIGHLPRQEITISEILKENGYTTGHFGKWHLGTLSKTVSSKGERRKPADKNNAGNKNPFYLNGVAQDPNDPSLKGGAGRIVMDRVIPFIESAVQKGQPFLAVIWFNAPHGPVVASPEHHKYYTDRGATEGQAHYYGCITEMDEQIGRLRDELKRLGVADNTLITFTSDNGPEGTQSATEVPDLPGNKATYAGLTGGLRGRKRSLYEGGVRVPTLALWPGKIAPGTVLDQETSTLDYLPTIAELMSYQMPDDRPIDGVSLLPLFTGHADRFSRPKAIPFRPYKLVITPGQGADKDELYYLAADRGEANNVIAQHPERARLMRRQIMGFLESAKASHRGADYNDASFQPVDSWPE